MNHSVHPHKGFTLIELVVVMIVLGILGVGISGFLRSTVQQYVDFADRNELKTTSSFIVRRINRELMRAVPNSVRIRGNSSSHCLQFVPIMWASNYIDMPLAPSTDREIDVVAMYDIDGFTYDPSARPDQAIIYPLEAEDVYDASQGKRRTVTDCRDDGPNNSCATNDDPDEVVEVEVSGNFAANSPASRVYFVNDAVSYCVRGGNMFLHYDNITTTQPLHTSGGIQVASNIANTLSNNPLVQLPNTEDPFRWYDATLRRNAFVRVVLAFEENNQVISFLQEVHVPNVP